jgi:hypothetical protein
MSWVSILTYPLLLVLGLTIQLLSYLLATLLFLASPVIYIGHVVLYLALLPLRILVILEVCNETKIYDISCRHIVVPR